MQPRRLITLATLLGAMASCHGEKPCPPGRQWDRHDHFCARSDVLDFGRCVRESGKVSEGTRIELTAKLKRIGVEAPLSVAREVLRQHSEPGEQAIIKECALKCCQGDPAFPQFKKDFWSVGTFPNAKVGVEPNRLRRAQLPTQISVTGTGFPPKRSFEIKCHLCGPGSTTAMVTTNENGAFTATIRIPRMDLLAFHGQPLIEQELSVWPPFEPGLMLQPVHARFVISR